MSHTYAYSVSSTATGEVDCEKLESEIDVGLLETLLVENGTIKIIFASELIPHDKTTLDSVVSLHQHITTAESLRRYLNEDVHLFVQKLVDTFAAENIAMGVTQYGKTADLLGLFEKKYDLGASHPVSLKGSLDTGSLYVSCSVIQHIRDNPAEFSEISPFVTDARLLSMKNSIETFLGLGLST